MHYVILNNVFKEIQCNSIQLYNEVIERSTINISLLLFDYYRTNNTHNNSKDEIDQILNELDALLHRAQVIISIDVILPYV